MRHILSNSIEIILGAIILGLGLLHLTSQARTTDRLIETVLERELEEDKLYQQRQEVDLGQVADEELYALVMGYREYPITIDGNVIPADGVDYESYFTLIREGYYTKQYVYDGQHHIYQIVFTYSGT